MHEPISYARFPTVSTELLRRTVVLPASKILCCGAILRCIKTSSAGSPGEAMRSLPKFDLFFGRYGEQDATWIETVDGLGNAADRMNKLAREKPGAYFVFHSSTHQVLGSVDTTPKSGTKSEVA